MSEDTIPYKGIWLITKKINKVNYEETVRTDTIVMRYDERHTPVHMSFWLKGTLLVSGAATSGRRGVKGLIKSRKRTADTLAIN